MIYREMEKLQEVLRIVQGNEYPIKIFLEKMVYSGNALHATAIDLRMVEDIAVGAVNRCGFSVPLNAYVSDDGSYVTVLIPDNKKMRIGPWGIRLTGVYDGLRIASAERHVFDIVKWNGESYVPPLLVDGEGSYLLNMKFVPGDADAIPSSKAAGWIGFAQFANISDLNVETELQHQSDLLGTYALENTVNGAHFVVACEPSLSLSILFGGLEIEPTVSEGSDYKYYYTSGGQITGTYDIEIRIKTTN